MPDIGRFESVLLCEDIRREDNGKIFASGIYTGDIVPFSYPANLALRLFVHYFAPKAGSQPLNFVWYVDDVEVATMEGGVEQADPETPVGLYLPPIGLTYTKPARLRIDADVNGDRQTIITRRVVGPEQAPEGSLPR